MDILSKLSETWRAKALTDRMESAELNARLQRGETVTIQTTTGPYLDMRETCAKELDEARAALQPVVEKLVEAGQALSDWAALNKNGVVERQAWDAVLASWRDFNGLRQPAQWKGPKK